jgi:hypothetical protein
MATTTNLTTALTDVPATLKPYVTDAGGILPTAQALLNTTTNPYSKVYEKPLLDAGLLGSGRVAGLSSTDQVAFGNKVKDLTIPTEFTTGTNAVTSGIASLAGLNDPTKYKSYMSPYEQNVIDVNKLEAMRDAQKGLVQQNLASARQGSYGGARNVLAMTEADRNLQTKLGNIQATGMQNAFDAATKNMLAQAQGYNAAGNTYGALGTAKEAANMDILKTQGAYADLQRSIQQQQLDAQYKDALDKINYPLSNLETMNNLVRGAPLVQTGQANTTTTPPPSFASQLSGMGLTGLALYNMFGNKA